MIEATCGGGGFEVCSAPAFYHDVIYRLQPEPLRDISLPWAALDDRWQWAARDEGGGVWVYSGRPELSRRVWSSDRPYKEITGLFANFDPGNKPWGQSLIKRPGVEK